MPMLLNLNASTRIHAGTRKLAEHFARADRTGTNLRSGLTETACLRARLGVGRAFEGFKSNLNNNIFSLPISKEGNGRTHHNRLIRTKWIPDANGVSRSNQPTSRKRRLRARITKLTGRRPLKVFFSYAHGKIRRCETSWRVTWRRSDHDTGAPAARIGVEGIKTTPSLRECLLPRSSAVA